MDSVPSLVAFILLVFASCCHSSDLLDLLLPSTRIEDLEPALHEWKTPCFTASGKNNGNIFACAPSVVVVGVGKAGTSAMYRLLSMHENAIAEQRKEICPSGNSNEEWLAYLKAMPQASAPHEFTVNGCIATHEVMPIYSRLRGNRTKFIIMVRNYADYIYAAYNFWCKPGYDDNCLELRNRVDESLHYRSTSMFHEIVLASDKEGLPLISHPWSNTIKRHANIFKPAIELVRESVGYENLLIIKCEDLLEDSRSVFQRISLFLDIDFSGFPESTFNRYMVNVHGMQGVIVTEQVPIREYKGGSLKNETRSILDSFWEEEKEWLKEFAAVAY